MNGWSRTTAWDPRTRRFTNTIGTRLPFGRNALLGRADDQSVDPAGGGVDDLELSLRVVARVDDEHLVRPRAGKGLGCARDVREVRVREVRHDDRDHTGPAGDQAARGAVGFVPELGRRVLHVSRVSGRTISGRASARDAVDTVTPARFATSTSRTAPRGGGMSLDAMGGTRRPSIVSRQ